MNIQVLVATMNQKDYELLNKMNIQTDVIVGNQCDRNSIETFEFKGHKATYLNFVEKGVGLNRNNALMRATGDICLFADDDMIYVDEYEKIVRDAFVKNPSADVLIFNVESKLTSKANSNKAKKINVFNYMKYGTVRLAIKRKSIRFNAIYFNQCFGGGTEYSHGEDSLFLTYCLQKKLEIRTVPVTIAELTDERGSTWRNTDTNKYLDDQGCLYSAISHRWSKMLCLQDAIRHHHKYGVSIIKAYKRMLHGLRDNQLLLGRVE